MQNILGSIRTAIATSPTTNLKNILAIRAAFMTVGMFWITSLLEIHVDPYAFGLLCGFILTWMFDGRKQFQIKRDSDWQTVAMRNGVQDNVYEQITERRQNSEAIADGTEIT